MHRCSDDAYAANDNTANENIGMEIEIADIDGENAINTPQFAIVR